jgi:hypothetical protein
VPGGQGYCSCTCRHFSCRIEAITLIIMEIMSFCMAYFAVKCNKQSALRLSWSGEKHAIRLLLLREVRCL